MNIERKAEKPTEREVKYCECMTMFQHTKDKCTGKYKTIKQRREEANSSNEVVEVRGD